MENQTFKCLFFSNYDFLFTNLFKNEAELQLHNADLAFYAYDFIKIDITIYHDWRIIIIRARLLRLEFSLQQQQKHFSCSWREQLKKYQLDTDPKQFFSVNEIT